MAHQITDARQETVSIPRKFNPKWLVISLVVACVIGGSVGGYYLYDYVTSTVVQPPPVVQPRVVAPVTTPTETQTPAQPETPMPVLEVAWEEVKLPPLKYGYDDISGLLIENGGNTISVYRCIGPANNGTATLYSLWRTTDGGKIWNQVEEVILYPDQEKQLGFVPMQDSWGGNQNNPYFSEREETLKSMPDPLTNFGNPYAVSRDPNNPDNIFVICQYGLTNESGVTDWSGPAARLFVSADGSWYQTNFPPWLAAFDAYPETPQLTLLKPFPSLVSIRIISSDDGSIKLFMAMALEKDGVFWKATIKSPN